MTDCREAELKYRTLFEQSPDGIVIIDTGGNILEFNEAAHLLLGYSREEFPGINIGDIDLKTPEQIRDCINRVLKEGKIEVEGEYRAKGGGIRNLRVISRTIVLSGRTVLLSIWRDITDTKSGEKSLRALNAGVQTLIQAIPDVVLFKDLDRRYLMVNKTVEEFTGLSQEELFGRTGEDLLPPDLADACKKSDEEVLKSRKTLHFEERYTASNGEEIIFDTIKAPIFDNHDAVVGLVAVSRDITERKKMEEALRTSRGFIESILDTVDQAFVVVDRDYRIILANSAYGGQSSMPVEDLIGRHCYEISHQGTRPCYEAGEECAVRHSFEKGEPRTCVHKHYNRDGGIIYVETKSYPLKDAAGEVVSAIEVINNITDKHLLEEQILRTQKLEAVGLLAGGIAHDFNNLLMGIFGGISMAKTFSKKDGKPYRMLEEAEKALGQARNLTKQLLTFSKGGEPVKSVIYLPSVIHSSVKFALSGSTVNYVFSMDDDLWLVEADEGQMKQVMHNLVINAGEAMPEGGTVRIEAKNVLVDGKGTIPVRKGKYVRIALGDTGTGISDSHIARIFDPYFTTKQRGSGLGLTTSYSIIKKHGGIIDVKSELGSGTTFFIYIPASEEKTLPEKTHEKRSFNGKGRILLMDDEEVVRTVAGYMLTILGYEVDFAEIGEKAVEKYSEAMKTDNPFKAVILDLTVRGGMGGKDTLRRLYEEDPEVLAVVSSGYSEDSILSNYKEYGFKAVLSKPYDIEELGRQLYSLFEEADTPGPSDDIGAADSSSSE
jgi:PAS domain S-box-containing protein